jgi:hypothetical protein
MRSALMIAAALALVGCQTPEPGGEAPVRDVVEVASGAPEDLTRIGGARACEGEVVRRGPHRLLELTDGSVVTRAPMAINVDGSARAYHPENFDGGAIIHLCNAGRVHLPDGTKYHGSESNATCVGRFMDDVARIGEAGWTDPDVGAVEWYGIEATGRVRIAGSFVRNVVPVMQSDGSGFFVSPTALEDRSFDEADQRRYVDALTVPHAVVRRDSGIALGTFGVAVRTGGCPAGRACEPVPFIVADIGPAIGEGSVALSREVSGLPVTEEIDRTNRFRGIVEGDNVMWIFFGGETAPAPYDRQSVTMRANAAYEAWGGPDRLFRCRRADIPAAGR